MALGSPRLLPEVAGALYAFDVPFVSVTLPGGGGGGGGGGGHGRGSGGGGGGGGHAAEDALLGKYDNLLTTVPDRAGQIRALVEVARARGLRSVSLVSSSHEASRVFVSEAAAAGVDVPRVLELGGDQDGRGGGGSGGDLSHSVGWRRFFHGGFYVEPHMPELEDFREYFVESLQVRRGGGGDQVVRANWRRELFLNVIAKCQT